MNKDIRIEHYLLQLDRELHALPVGQRAEIILEMKSHITEASEKNPSRNLEEILSDLGAPSAVAERYLSAKGLAYVKKPSTSRNWLKILALGTAAVFAFFVVGTVLTIWYFSPLIKVDEAKGHVSLFGGAIDIKEDSHVKIGSNTFDIAELEELEQLGQAIEDGIGEADQGQEDLSTLNVKRVSIPFANGKLVVKPSASSILNWNCEGGSPSKEINEGTLVLSLNSPFASCTLQIPTVSDGVEVIGANGKVELIDPQMPMKVALVNGKVGIQPDQRQAYNFNISVQTGKQDNFSSSTLANAIPVKVEVQNGVVKQIQ